ncbi:MAG: hypothetical protein O3A01_02125 [bacterium]|nr:hypothetical protein [bacterium]
MKKLLTLLLLLCASAPALALPSYTGHTGLVMMPTAEALPYRKANIAVDYNMGERDDEEKDVERPHFYKVNIGTFQNVELGFVGGSVPTEGVFINAKYFLMSNNERWPLSIATGIEKLGSDNQTAAYMVSTKAFKGGWKGHFGFKATFKEELDASAIFGVEHMLDDRITLMAEVLGEEKEYMVNAGLRLYLYTDVALHISVIDFGQNVSNETSYTFGISLAGFM